MQNQITNDSKSAILNLIEAAKLKQNQIVVIGCSTSEVAGKKIGTNTNEEIATAIFEGIYPVIKERKLCLAVQCCEHLNRAIIIERALADILRLPIVNAVPHLKAGGAFATVSYNNFSEPVCVENISADAGMDIGGTLIGMNLKSVAVPVRIEPKHIGEAIVIYARTRPKFIGGERAKYNTDLL
ncbi:MAG: TIGR01440 family protein [Bacillota bacterium]|nr:TIGR01440 family protein [Bacillota bacterium]